jgi:uncharacterized protein VirK/YbjX
MNRKCKKNGYFTKLPKNQPQTTYSLLSTKKMYSFRHSMLVEINPRIRYHHRRHLQPQTTYSLLSTKKMYSFRHSMLGEINPRIRYHHRRHLHHPTVLRWL